LIHYFLYDLNGKLIKQGNFSNQIQLATQDFESNIYILKLIDSDKIYMSKLIKH
jgi:hypothetical protein